MAELNATELLKEPAFHRLLSAGLALLSSQAGVTQGLSAPQLQSYMKKTKRLGNDLKGRSSLGEGELPKELSEISGLTSPQLNETFIQMHAAAKELNGTYPRIAALDQVTRQNFFFDAIRKDDDAMATIKRVAASASAQTGDSAEADECETGCLLKYILTITLAISSFISAIIGCAFGILLVPLALLCWAISSVSFFWALGQGQGAFDNCMATCEGS